MVKIRHHEPTRPDGENRDAYMARFACVNRPLWSELTTEEWDAILRHVTQCDFPETASGWASLGCEAGFAAADQLFAAPTDLYRVFRFRA
jgi:hypothetical protein